MQSQLKFVFFFLGVLLMTIIATNLNRNHRVKEVVTLESVKNSLEGEKYFTIYTKFGDQIDEHQRDQHDQIMETGEGSIVINYDGSYFNVNIKDYYAIKITRVRY